MVRYVEDYLDEMKLYFPQIEEEYLLGMMNNMTTILSKEMKKPKSGMFVKSSKTMLGDGKKHLFKISRIFSPLQKRNYEECAKRRNKLREALYGEECKQQR